MSKVKSPCINICHYRDGKCLGCYRTLEEIANWNNYSDKQKKEVLIKVSERKLNINVNYYG